MDVAVGLVFFNPCRSTRMVMNYLYTKNRLETQGIPTFTLELTFNGRRPELEGAFQVRSDSYMFHKERMFRILETKIPEKYKKIALLDADLVYEDIGWYLKTSLLLDTHDAVQCFDKCIYLGPSYETCIRQCDNVFAIGSKNFNPGLAWAFRRDWYNQNGFFEYDIMGNNDTISGFIWLKRDLFNCLSQSVYAAIEEYKRTIQTPRVTFIKGCTVHHLFHGPLERRNYVNRNSLLDDAEDVRNELLVNNDGMFEWKSPRFRNIDFLNYFKLREDDAV